MEAACGKVSVAEEEERASLLRKTPRSLHCMGARACRLPLKVVISLGLLSVAAVLVASPLLSARRRHLLQLRSILRAHATRDRNLSTLTWVNLQSQSPRDEQSCKNYGCGDLFDKSRKCQCNSKCVEHGSCCSDYAEVCRQRHANQRGGGDRFDEDAQCKILGCGTFDETHACQCNAACTTYNNCCKDFHDVCSDNSGSNKASCEHYGCAPFDKTRECQCDEYCSDHHNCCSDYHRLCKTATKLPVNLSSDSDNSCKVYGCQSFNPHHSCQCNAECTQHMSCCKDFEGSCKGYWQATKSRRKPDAAEPSTQQMTPQAQPEPETTEVSTAPATTTVATTTTVLTTPAGPVDTCDLEYNGGNQTMCFCQLAGNRGCIGTKCDCPQGCNGIVWPFPHCVSFRNLKEAYGCPNPVALLTIPKSYFKTIQSLRDYCPAHMGDLLAEMLKAGYDSYQAYVNPGPVKQCIHAGFIVSQAWLHVHTICDKGSVDGMTVTNNYAWCGVMDSGADAEKLAAGIMAWAAKGEPMPSAAPSTCEDIGCGVEPPRPICSCKAGCQQQGRCCGDIHSVCKDTTTSHHKITVPTTAPPTTAVPTTAVPTTPVPTTAPPTSPPTTAPPTTTVPETEIAIR